MLVFNGNWNEGKSSLPREMANLIQIYAHRGESFGWDLFNLVSGFLGGAVTGIDSWVEFLWSISGSISWVDSWAEFLSRIFWVDFWVNFLSKISESTSESISVCFFFFWRNDRSRSVLPWRRGENYWGIIILVEVRVTYGTLPSYADKVTSKAV